MKHPTITLGRLDAEVRQMLAKGGIDPRHAKVVLHTPLEREHERDRRRYAQVIPDELVFEFATATLALAPEHRTGLVAHEVGHCIAWRRQGEHSEDDADAWAERVLGIEICYDLDWPGKGLQTVCQIEAVRQLNPRRRNGIRRGWPKQGTPPKDPNRYVVTSALEQAYRDNYVRDGQVIASSRTKKAEYPALPIGTWKVDDGWRGMYGHEIEELVLVDDPRVLEPGEFDWSDPAKRLRVQGKIDDMERYAQWMAEGHNYPPIHVVQTERGTLRITDGHRRAAAADSKGLPIKAWISWLTPHPDPLPGREDDNVGLTYEIATGREWSMPRASNPTKTYYLLHNRDAHDLGLVRKRRKRTGDVREDYTLRVPGTVHQWDHVRRRAVASGDMLAIDDAVNDGLVDSDAIVVELGKPGKVHWLGDMRVPERNPKEVITHAEGASVSDDAFTCAHQVADMFGADVQFEHYDNDKPESDTLAVRLKLVPRVATQRHLSLVENPKARGFNADQVEKIREAFEYCMGNKLESRRMWARYEAAKPTPRAVPIRMTIRKREARQSDLFGNPFYMTEGRLYQQTVEPDSLYFVSIKKAKNGNWTGIMVRTPIRGGTAKATQTSIDPYGARLWQAIDPVHAPTAVVRAFENRGVQLSALANPQGNLADLRFDGRVAQQRYRDLRSGAVKIHDSIEDRRTGAYMALLLEQAANEPEIFHIEPDGHAYVIEYGSNREAQDDWDSLLSRFQRKNPCGCKHANARSGRNRSRSVRR